MDPNVSNVLFLVYLILFPGNAQFLFCYSWLLSTDAKLQNRSLQFLNVKHEWYYLPAGYVVAALYKELTEPIYVN